MWLLKFHVGFSIMCILIIDGFSIMFSDAIKKNGWVPEKKTGLLKKIWNHWMYFIPLMNILAVFITFMLIGMTKARCKELFGKNKEGKDEQKV